MHKHKPLLGSNSFWLFVILCFCPNKIYSTKEGIGKCTQCDKAIVVPDIYYSFWTKAIHFSLGILVGVMTLFFYEMLQNSQFDKYSRLSVVIFSVLLWIVSYRVVRAFCLTLGSWDYADYVMSHSNAMRYKVAMDKDKKTSCFACGEIIVFWLFYSFA